ncbi:MAG: 30S ribosomal protein S6 [bacterium]
MSEKDNARVYELGYLFVSSLSDEQAVEKATALKEMINQKGGKVIADENPKFTELAYEMYKYIANKKTKFSHGYFGWVKFTGPADMIAEMKAVLDLDVDMLRFMTIKTVAENTMAPKKFSAKTERTKRRDDSSASVSSEAVVDAPAEEVVADAEEAIIDEEVVDEKIDEMATEE